MSMQNLKKWFSTHLNQVWYENKFNSGFLLPITYIYVILVTVRRWFLQRFVQHQFPVPIIVIGNLTVGGVGKTPLVISLAKQLQRRGVRVGIVSRGYGAKIKHFPHEVHEDEAAELVGDEPLLLAKKTQCPVVIAPKRVQAVKYLLKKHTVQVILSDDGLQHYAMGRAIEVVVIDGLRGFGNQRCLPAGPMRETLNRLYQADFVIVNESLQDKDSTGMLMKMPRMSYRMQLQPGPITQLISGQMVGQKQLTYPVAAVAAIGNPQRFFATLDKMGIVFNPYSFVDHHIFDPNELCFHEKMIVMTEKDAVKCISFATEKMYFLPIEARVDDHFWTALWSHPHLQDSLL